MADSSTNNSGIGFCGLLTIVFITLKLLEIITWSWVWVLAPLWITFSIFIVLIFIVAIIAKFY